LEYCSDYCKISAEEEYCGCGHESCNLHFAEPPAAAKAVA
jgi:hypothetical protein